MNASVENNFTAIWICLFVFVPCRKSGVNMNATTCLNELLRKYDKRIRPGIFGKHFKLTYTSIDVAKILIVFTPS